MENRFGIVERDIPPYDTKDDGSVDEQKMLGETELNQFIIDNTPYYTEANADIIHCFIHLGIPDGLLLIEP